MTQKWVEIRDRGTLVPALALRLSGADGWLAERAGFGDVPCVLLVNLARCACQWDPYEWHDRTMHVAHSWLCEHWDEFVSGGVVDVQFILGETDAQKVSEQAVSR